MTAVAPRARGRLATLAAIAVLLTLAPASTTPAAGQVRTAVLEEPDGTTVAVSVLLNAGSVWEPESQAGVSYVAAHAVLEEIAPQLSALDVDATVTCSPADLRFTLLAPPITWRVATDILLRAIFGHAVDEIAVDDAKATVLRYLEQEVGNPEYEIRAAVRRALYGDEDRWSRPACGRIETVATLTPDDVRALMRARFLPSRAAAAVAGPVDDARARRVLIDALGDATLPVVLARPPSARTGERLILERSTVTAWIGIAYPLPDETEREMLRLLGREIEREFAPGPRHPDVYGVRTTIEPHGARDVFVIYLVTAAESADDWAERVRDRIATLADIPLGEQTFDALLRDHRGRRLRTLAAPEARARDAVRQVFHGRSYDAPVGRISTITAEGLRRTAALLGAPTTAVLGPPPP